MKNIGIIIQKLKNGGAERAAANLSKDLSENYNVYLITFDSKNIAYDYSGTLIDLNIPATNNKVKKIIHFFRRIIEVKKIKKEKKLDACISFMEGANVINVLTKVKDNVIISERNLPSFFYNKKSKMKYIWKKADKIVTLSKLVKEDLIKTFGVDSNKITAIYNSCDKRRLDVKSEDAEMLIKTLDKNQKYIITMGRLNYQKGQWHLIKAFKIVKEKNPNTKLLILGQGELERKLKILVKSLQLENDIYFLGYIKNPHRILNLCDVFVFSSIVEGLGNVLLEALAFNKAIVSTDCNAGPREILAPDTQLSKKTKKIEYAEYGILVPAPSNEDFNEKDISINKQERTMAEAIIKLLKDDNLRKKYEKKAEERIKDFSPEVIKKEWINIIEK